MTTDVLEGSAGSRSVPMRVHCIENQEAAALYKRALVLVRPDGHVAWRGDQQPGDAMELIDTVRGAGPCVAACRAVRSPPRL